MSTKQDYLDALKRFDWFFEFSDDHFTWRRGNEELKRLYEMQSAFDPSGELWRAAQPDSIGVPHPRVQSTNLQIYA